MARQSHPESSEFRRQVDTLFARAAHAFGELKDVVVRNSQIGKIKLDTQALRRDRDLLLQRLGEACLEAIKTGAMPS